MAKIKTKWMLLLIACLIIVLLFCTPVAAKNDGEIISANSKPDILVSGQTVTYEVTVKNTGTNSLNYQVDVKSSSGLVHTIEFLLEAGETKKVAYTSTMGDSGPRTFYYRLYIDWTWPATNELLDTVIETRRCYSVEEVSDYDHDNLPYYVEVEDLKTDPNNPDTDGDGKRDDVDKRPTIAEGSISIMSNPSGANIYFDGTSKGITSSTLIDIPIGSHTVKLTKSGYNDILKTVTIISGQTISFSESLIAQTGSISVSSNPSGANVYLDGTSKGTTPITLHNVPIGSHTVKLTKSGYTDISKSVTVSSGKTASVSTTLTAQTGSISISSNPSGTNVYLDGTSKGITPITLKNIPVGSYTIKLTKSGYTDLSKTVTVSSGMTASVSANLSPDPILLAACGILFLLLLFLVVVVARKKKKSASSSSKTVSQTTAKITKAPTKSTTPVDTIKSKEESRINTSSAFGYKGATIIHKIKIKNPTSDPIGDIKIHLFVPDVFLLENKEKTISMLEPGESKTVTFEIRPTGECGECNVSGRVNYYDYSTKKRQETDLEIKSLSIVCPLLRVKEINKTEWRNIVNHLVKTEETTQDISMPSETLFNLVSRVIEDMNMFILEPEVTSTPQMFNGVARFYGEGVKELKYAAQIEVVGGAKRSKLILKAWAEREDALTGFYHGILDELEKRVQVKGYINDSIVQNFYHYGDNIGTQVKDSLVQRSNIGTGTDVKKCPNCGRDVDVNEKFCLECGAKL